MIFNKKMRQSCDCLTMVARIILSDFGNIEFDFSAEFCGT